MSEIIISAENISKQYRLGTVGSGTLSHDINRWWNKIRGKEDPFMKIGDENDRTQKGGSDYVWALKDINFNVTKGEVLGIIGRNGAGKSTLLKILSRTTTPSTGKIKVKGRIASLLEVGTGFHPELTGRENIFLNGAILGMTKSEIKSKFDEIVDFAGVAKYIDTPVKRYSSGMYVRLAFGVAAHLEPEILIVDEVLAVGDAEFQKKALGKMKEVSKEDGRTVLFVSHNMTAIKNLCSSVIYMENGRIIQQESTEKVINNYLNYSFESINHKEFLNYDEAPGNQFVKLKYFSVKAKGKVSSAIISVDTAIEVQISFWNTLAYGNLNLSMGFYTLLDECVFVIISNTKSIQPGLTHAYCEVPENLLNDGTYKLSLMVVRDGNPIYNFTDIVNFEVVENREPTAWHGKWPGFVRPKLNFNLI